ncbi:MAG: hypothetical protein ACRCSG_07580 [Cellulosilyticaceae bacterium]
MNIEKLNEQQETKIICMENAEIEIDKLEIDELETENIFDENYDEEENEEDDDEPIKPLVVMMKENLYDNINVSLQTMNIFIGGLVTAIIVFVGFGIWQAAMR